MGTPSISRSRIITPVNHLFRIALAAAAFTAGTPGSAAELQSPVDAGAVAAMSLEELLRVSVSVASRTEETFTQAPSSVTVFTRAEIQSMGVRTIEELLNFAPGFCAGRSASSSYGVGVRGKMSSQLSNDVLFLINGQRLNDDFSDAALLFNRLLTTDNVKQVEIVRGPGSALYGSDALLGVVNIVTAENLNEVRVGMGSNQRREGYASLSGRIGGADASLFVGGFRDDGEPFTDLSSPDLARARDPQQSLTANLSLGLDNTRVEARLARFQLDDFYIFVTPSDPNGVYRSSDAWLRISQDLWTGDDGHLTANARLRRIDHESLVTVLPGELMAVLAAQGWTLGSQDFRAGAVVQQTELGTSLDGELRLSERQTLAAGLDFRQTRFDKTLNQNNYETADVSRDLPCINALLSGSAMPLRCNFAFIRPYGRVIESSDFAATGDARDILGLYLQDEIRLRADLKATLGLRLDQYSDFGQTVDPRAALVYSPAAHTTLKLMYGEAFRAPTVSELALKNTPDLIGNPELQPEKVRTIEAAWLQSFEGVQTTLTGYFSHVRDRIERTPPQGGLDPRPSFANGGGLNLSGIELEIQDQLTDSLLLRGSFTHSFEYAEDPQAVPQNLASFSLNYHHKRLNMNLNGFYHGTAETGSTPPVKLDDYWVLNANLRYDLGQVTLTGGVYNLLDEAYYTYTNLSLPQGIPNRGRELRLGVELRL